MRSSKNIVYYNLIYPVSFILLFMLAFNAFADDVIWDGGGDSNLWSEAENWEPDVVPTINDGAQIDVENANCLIDNSVAAECMSLDVGFDTGPCYLKMTGGTLTMSDNLVVANHENSSGVFVMNGGTVDTGNGRLWVGYNKNTSGTFILNGGVITVANKIEVGKNGGAYGELIINGGTLNLMGQGSDDLEIGKYGTGIITMTGGELTITDNIKLGQSGGSGIIYLYGGTINNGNDEPVISNDDSFIDITEGTLLLPGDATEPINELIGSGRITAYEGLGRVVAEYDAAQDSTTVIGTRAAPELAWDPSPRNWATVEWTFAGPTLSWKPGEYPSSHDIYFGTDWDDVNDANNTPGAWPEFKGNQDNNNFEPGILSLDTTYYWRIDEVNDNAWAPAGSPWKGTVWEFTMADYVVADDMESYGDADTPGPPPPAGSRIWFTWRDGEGWTRPTYVPGNGSGSIVDPNNGIVHEGEQSLKFSYDNDGTNLYGSSTEYYSEISVDTSYLAVGQDWTVFDVNSLVIWFYGDADNDANATEQMYVKLNGVKVNYDGDLYDITDQQWHEWNIDLAAFGVDMTNVTSLAIGFGDEAGTTPGGSGAVCFDDIRLYSTRCVPSRVQLAGDLDNDCDVDYDDLEIMSDDWLDSDYSDVGSDGVLMNFPDDNSQWVDNAGRGRCLQLDGVDDWVDLDDRDFSDFHNKTISLWVKIREFPDPYPHIFSFQNAGDTPYRIYIRTRGTNAVRGRFVEDYFPEFLTGANFWYHLAFVIRDTAGNKCTGEFYGNGALVGKLPGRPRHSGGAKGVNLGSFSDGSSGFADAVYDEFRVYDYALSHDEILYLAEVQGGVEPTGDMMLYYKFDEVSGFTAKNSSTHVFNRPLVAEAELYKAEAQGSRSVNFRDYAAFAETWLQEQLWP